MDLEIKHRCYGADALSRNPVDSEQNYGCWLNQSPKNVFLYLLEANYLRKKGLF